MREIHRGHALKGEFQVNPDREVLIYAMALGALARGRTLLEDCPITPLGQSFANWLSENQIQIQRKGNAWEIEGAGLRSSYPPSQRLPLDPFASFVALCLLSRDQDTLFDFGSDAIESSVANDLQRYFQGRWQGAYYQFSEPSFSYTLSASGEVPHLVRMRLLLQALLQERSLVLEERSTSRDQISGLLSYYGAPLSIENSGAEEMDELARRMARMQGQKMERKVLTKLSPCKILAGKEIVIAGDATEAAALALLATQLPDSDILIRGVSLNPGRAGFFNALKRMGGLVEVSQRRERYGDSFGTFRVQAGKRLVGRKLSGEQLSGCIEEVPLLAIAACFAEGESILRLPDHLACAEHSLLENLSQNIKLAGIEVGLYDEGLVLRGREEVDANHFHAHYPVVALALATLARAAHGRSHVEGLELVEQVFPGILSKLGVS